MRFILFEFPGDVERLNHVQVVLRRSAMFWIGFVLLFLGGVLFGWKAFVDPQSSVISMPPTQANEWGLVGFWATWMGVVIAGFLLTSTAAVLSKDGVRLSRLLLPARSIPFPSLGRIDLNLRPGGSLIEFRSRGGSNLKKLFAIYVRDSDLKDLCRTAGLKVQ